MVYLAATTLLARRQGHRLVVAVPPARSDYKRACGAPAQTLFRSLTEMRVELEIGAFDIFNVWNDSAFTDDCFCDFDHLDPAGPGPGLISRKLANALGVA